MCTYTRLVIVLFSVVLTAAAINAQIASNPIPAPIVKRGLAVEIKDVVRLPDTRGMRPADQDVTPSGWARISYVRDLPDGRRFVNDSRGFLYLIGADHKPQVYANVAAAFPHAVYNRGLLNDLFPLPAEVLNGREKDGFTYPVAMYDHDEGRAVTGGFVYHGRIAGLRDKFIFGDIQNGRVFAADLAELKKADDGIPQTVAAIEEVQLYVRDASGNKIGVSMRELVERTMGATLARVDLHIARTSDGELLLTSRQDGTIRMLVPESTPSATPATRR